MGDGVLHAADFGALCFRHRGHGDRHELGRRRAHAEPDQQKRDGDDLRTGTRIECGHQDQRAGEQGKGHEPHDPAR